MAAQDAEVHRRAVRQLVAKHIARDETDRELLDRFSGRMDESAFEILVRRHAGLVLATARRVFGNAHDAEDICQAVFLLLARKAGSRRWQPSVASWLHRTAHYLALKARTAAARRARREGHAAIHPPADPLDELTGRELLAVLDEELLGLPESLRAPLVLCYLQGATRDEAAGQLGCQLSTLKKRLERGRGRLHAALTRRGLGLSVGLLSTLLSREGAGAAPAALVRLTARNAQGLVAGGPGDGGISPQVRQLIRGGMGMVGWKKVKAGLGVLLVGGLLSAAAFSAGEDKPTPPPKEGAVAPSPRSEPPAAAESIRVVVLDPEGKPLSGANVHAGVWTDEPGFKANRDQETDATGTVRMELPKSFTIVRLWAGKKPFVTLFANWEQAEVVSNGVPTEYSFRMEAATTAGGRVLDEHGKPVVGARVEVMLANDPKPARSDGRVHYDMWLATGNEAATTDAEGRWQITTLPNHPETKLSLIVSHPDFVSDEHWSKANTSTKLFREGTATTVLKRGIVIRGRVTDPDGHPVKDAVVIHGDDPYGGHTTSKFATDADGRYRLPALPPGTRSLTVIAPGWAPQLRKVELKPDVPAQDFRLGPGQPIRLRFVDASGKPVPRAIITLKEWKGSKSIYSDHNPNHPKTPDTGIPRRADGNGVWEWPSAPDDPVKLQIYAKGFPSVELDVTGGSVERTVTLKAEHRITGTVTDAVTGKPIPTFTVIPVDVFRKDYLHAERGSAVAGSNGRLDFLATRTDIPLRLRVEVPGYRTQDGPEFRVGGDGGRIQHFRLQPSQPLTGVVLNPNGRPAAKAEVLIATPTEQVRLFHQYSTDPHKSFTDEVGRFAFPDPGEPWVTVAQTDAGIALAEYQADRSDAGTLKVRPWGSVRGKFSDGGKPVSGAEVRLEPIRLNGLGWPRLTYTLHVTTDSDGRFEFPRVPPGLVSVQVFLSCWKDPGYRSGPSVPLDLAPGGRVDLDLGSGGATLTGRVKLTGKAPSDLNCTYSMNYLVRREPGVAPPPNLANLGFDVRKGFQESWLRTPEGLTYLSTLQNWFVRLSPDGSFRVNGVPPGEYDLAVSVFAKPSGCLVDPLARRVVRVTVTAADVARGELAVPEFAAEVVPIPVVGDTPTLTFGRADGTSGKLADCRGKYTVVHFWASWCAPCKKQLPALRKLHDRFAARGVAALGLALDDDPTAWQTAFKLMDLPWSQGRVSSESTHGVSSVPTYWLLDPAGKIVAATSDVDELARAIEGRLKEMPGNR
ncbi:MAG: hypothetical protein JWO38_3912 [Gemmataceae bacterium]|nr:hypothetical protein [Gemmataceae bacterium]